MTKRSFHNASLSQQVWDKTNKTKPNIKKETVKQKQNDKRKYELKNSFVISGTLSMPAILCILVREPLSMDCQLHIDNPSDNSLHFRNECWLLYIVISLDSNLSTDGPNLFIHMKECCLLPILSIHPHERVLFVANFCQCWQLHVLSPA
jgi:hypothetical protein